MSEENGWLTEVPWETRNLGVPSFTLSERFIAEPEVGVLRDALAQKTARHGRIFVQARLAKPQLPLARHLEAAGFYYVESTLVPHSVLKKNLPLAEFVRDPGQVLPRRYRPEDFKVLTMDKNNGGHCQRVREIAGESFSDDRFHLDVNCSKEIADRRYVYWSEDLLKDDNAVFYVLCLRGEVIGFMIRKGDNLLLAGVAAAYVKSGLGEYLWLSVLDDMLRTGLMEVRSLISSNNTAVLNLYARIGFRFREPAATFHYWGS
jgi:ribosomal protein S18 acetylase RimI-like enzyme